MARSVLIQGGSSGGDIAEVDFVHPALVTIDVVHRITHEGRLFTAGVFASAVAAILVLVRTHAT